VLRSIANVPRAGTAAAAASSNPNVSTSDNYVFSSSYESVTWWGEVSRQQIDDVGALSVPNWSAMRLLDCATTPWKPNTAYVGSWDSVSLIPAGPALSGNVFNYGGKCYVVKSNYTSGASFDAVGATGDGANTQVINADEAALSKVPAAVPGGRTIFTKGSSGLIAFNWAALGSLQSYFQKPWITYTTTTTVSTGLSQFCTPNSATNCLSATDQTAAQGQALVNYLRGDRTNEGTLFRQRIHVLGDIVASEGRYVKAPLFNYSDSGYGTFKTANASRDGVVYVAANDGMMHAFDAVTGQERWAYIPSMVVPDLYKLADMNYATQHQFFVDNTPEVGEICGNATGTNCAGTEWKTIVVGGLNRGGKGYYALDVTDPTHDPVLLWEFSDSRLGYTYGNPRITKLKSGQWVVLLSSGYNNSDGKGYLFVLDAKTGAPITAINGDGTISTGASSGAVRISAHVKAGDTDNTTDAVYGGDASGNLWRFDINDSIGPLGFEAQKLVSFVDSNGVAQPITAKPVTATINGSTVIFVGTGRYLGITDIGDTRVQSFYAVKDLGTATTYGNPRTAINGFVQRTMTSGLCASGVVGCTQGQSIRTTDPNAVDVDWATQSGWFVDFLTGGERAATDPSLGLGTLVFTTNLPSISSGTACGDPSKAVTNSFLYAFNYITGKAVEGASNVAGVSLGNGTVTRPVLIELADGTVRTLTRISNGSQGGNTIVGKPPIAAGKGTGLRKVSWRELTTQ
jgi:type IV pilus assembly protein PilY1